MDLKDAESLQDSLISRVYGSGSAQAFSVGDVGNRSVQMQWQSLKNILTGRFSKPSIGIALNKDGFRPAIRALKKCSVKKLVDALVKEKNMDSSDIDIQYIDPVRAFVDSTSDNSLCPGLSISCSESSLGTLGCFVRKNSGSDSHKLMFLSNNHVIVSNNFPVKGSKVYQMVKTESDEFSLVNEIGSLEGWVKLKRLDNEVDAAFACVNDDSYLSSINYINGLGFIQGKYEQRILPGLRVKKVGMRTGFTEGEVKAVLKSPLDIGYDIKLFGLINWRVTRYFINVIEIMGDNGEPFSAPGDSGSLILDQNNKAVALLFSGNSDRTYAISISEVFRQLDVDLA